MIDSNLNLKQVGGSKFYFGQWRYCMKGQLPEVSALRYNNYDIVLINDVLDQRESWRQRTRKRWKDDNSGIVRDIITTETRRNLFAFADIMRQQTIPHKLVLSMSSFYCYTNDLDFLNQLDRLPYLSQKNFTEIVVDRPEATLLLKQSDYAFRIYFRGIKLTEDSREKLTNFLLRYPDVRISPGLQAWMLSSYSRTMDYYFVDYNDPGWPLLLSLVQPGLIRKTMQIMTK